MPTRENLAQGILFATTRFEPDPVRTDTGADFIGSILTDFDENGDYIAERRYKPYGELLAGTATTYGWTGNTGSRFTVIQFAEQYNRRRHYSTKLKQWTSRDSLWPDESAYGYVSGGPLTAIDPSGEKVKLPYPYRNGKNYGCAAIPCCLNNTSFWENEAKLTGQKFFQCAAKVSYGICVSIGAAMARCDMQQKCSEDVAWIIDEGFRFKYIRDAIDNAAGGPYSDGCFLAAALDCQNSCMRMGYQKRSRSTVGSDLWSKANKVCRQYGKYSRECCARQVLAEQKEYDKCAKECFPALLNLPYEYRTEVVALKLLKCCG